MSYGSHIWGQAQTLNIKKISFVQNRATRLINFAPIGSHADPLYKRCNILRLSDIVNLQNVLYVYEHHHHNLPKALSNTFKSIKNVHSHLTQGSKPHKLIFPRVLNVISVFGITNITYQPIKIWNYLMENLSCKLTTRSRSFCKNLVKKHFLNKYGIFNFSFFST